MSTDLRKLLILFCLLCFILIAIWLLSRAPVQDVERSAEPELASALAQPQPSRARSLSHRFRQNQPAEQTSTTQPEPPEDPDEIRQWTRENPQQALAWMRAAPAGPQREAVAEIACAQVAETDPAQAVALAERYAVDCANLLENLVLQWSERDEPAARAYALGKPAGEERDRLLGRVALTRSRANPAEAANLVVEEMTPGEAQNEAVMSVLHQWALRDPQQAFAWVELFPECALRDRALKEVENLVSQTASQ